MLELTFAEGGYIAVLFLMSIAGIAILAEFIRKVFNINLWED